MRGFNARHTAILLGILVLLAVPAAAQTRAALPSVFLQVTDAERLLDAVTADAVTATGIQQVGLRIEVSIVPPESSAAAAELVGSLPANLPAFWLSVDTPASQDQVAAWREHLRPLIARRPAVLELRLTGRQPQLARFLAQIAATDAGATGITKIALGGSIDLASIYTPAVAPYVDAVVVRNDEERMRSVRHVGEIDPESLLLIAPSEGATDSSLRSIVADVFRFAGTVVAARAWPVTSTQVPDLLRSLASIEQVLNAQLSELDERVSKLRLTVDGRDVTQQLPHRLLFDNVTLRTLLVYWGEARTSPLDIEVVVPMEGAPVVHDLLAGTRTRAGRYRRQQDTLTTSAEVPITGNPMLVDFNEEAVDVFGDRTDVSVERQLTAGEIIARHRQQQARQDATINNYIARVRLQQHFRPTITDPGYDVVTENRYFVDREGVEWEELSFSVNGSKWGADRPPFPLLQPEKVLSLPLQLRFDEDYQYSLEGTGTAEGYDCYVIRFEPARMDLSLYRGLVWIDRKTFARVRVRAVQTQLSAPVVSNEEVQVYRPVPLPRGGEAFLLSSLKAHQLLLIAGRNLLLEKVATFESFHVNAPEFADERELARSSDRTMYRETDRGLRYLVKKGEKRVVSDRATTSAKAMAMGVTIDPSYSFPLPMFGINYLDFEFGNPDTQLAVLFAGVLAAGNIQRPKIGRTPLDASVDFFAIAVPSNDRIYDERGERTAERLLTWPLTTGANLGWQFTPFQKAAVQYQFRFDGFTRDRDTDESFVPPPSSTTQGLGGLWEYRRAGFSVVLNGMWNRRLGWREWGDPLAPEDSSSTYAKFSASISRDFLLGPFQKIHVDAAWFGGDDLDRLSRYQFGLFDATRIHGVPSSGLRFDDIVMARGAYSFNIFEQYRLDLFLDQAWGRDEVSGDGRQPITGIGAAVSVRAPWGTILRADIGKSFLSDRYRDIGSTVLQVMLLKPLR